MCVRIPNVTRKYDFICHFVTVVDKHLCVVANTVIPLKMSVAKRLEIGTTIKFCANIGKTPTDIYKELKRASWTSSVSRRLVFKWHKRSVKGRER
jgi:hypothetical protein